MSPVSNYPIPVKSKMATGRFAFGNRYTVVPCLGEA
jgi:hypothetical protein